MPAPPLAPGLRSCEKSLYGHAIACPYLNSQWVTSAEIARCRILHSFSRPGLHSSAPTGLRSSARRVPHAWWGAAVCATRARCVTTFRTSMGKVG
jgi:hypothetical protein